MSVSGEVPIAAIVNSSKINIFGDYLPGGGSNKRPPFLLGLCVKSAPL